MASKFEPVTKLSDKLLLLGEPSGEFEKALVSDAFRAFCYQDNSSFLLYSSEGVREDPDPMIEVHTQKASSGHDDNIRLSIYVHLVNLKIPRGRLPEHRFQFSGDYGVDSAPAIRHEGKAVEGSRHLVCL